MPEAGLARLRRHALGFVFQSYHLVDELTALENVELPGSARADRWLRSCVRSKRSGYAT